MARPASTGRLDPLEKVTVAMVFPPRGRLDLLFLGPVDDTSGRPTPSQRNKGGNWTNQFAVFEIRLPRANGTARLADVQYVQGVCMPLGKAGPNNAGCPRVPEYVATMSGPATGSSFLSHCRALRRPAEIYTRGLRSRAHSTFNEATVDSRRSAVGNCTIQLLRARDGRNAWSSWSLQGPPERKKRQGRSSSCRRVYQGVSLKRKGDMGSRVTRIPWNAERRERD